MKLYITRNPMQLYVLKTNITKYHNKEKQYKFIPQKIKPRVLKITITIYRKNQYNYKSQKNNITIIYHKVFMAGSGV